MSDLPRWLTFATHVPPTGSGGGMIRYAVEFSRAMTQRDDVDFHVLARHDAVPFFVDMLGSSERVHAAPTAPVPVVSLFETTAMGWRLGDFAVVHGTKHILPLRAPRNCHRVLTCHDMLPMDRPHDFTAAKRLLLREPYLRALEVADHVICVSEATRQRAAAYEASVLGKSAVVPLAWGELAREIQPDSPLSQLAGRPFALVVGDPSPRKNLGLLIEAMRAVRLQIPDAVLAVAGPPDWGVSPHAKQMQALVAEGGAVALGFVSDEELRWCYGNARAVCCPALLEGFGLPAVEALAMGAPLITSDDEALTEVSGASVEHLSSWDATAWVDPLVRHLRKARTNRAPLIRDRSWADVAQETVQEVLK